jgi:CHAD domain-containing protein
MPFRFKKKESVARAVRRLCVERLDDALETLEKGARLQAVHDVRKEIKKLRSVLRLIRRETSKNTYFEHTQALRQAANLLTDFRDAQVKLNAFDHLVKHFRRKLPPRPFPEIKAALQKNCHAEEKKLARAIVPLKGILSHSKKRFDELKIEARGWKAIAPGLKRIYRRGRESYETARQDPLPDNFHEWRKRVKDLWHQLRLLCPANPRNLRVRVKHLEALGNLLGDDHDLFMLEKFVTRKFKQTPNAQKLREIIFSRQQALRSNALKLGHGVYREKAGRFCRRMEADWKGWRKQG